MGQGELGMGESPAMPGSFHALGPGGLPLKKKLAPKSEPKKLTMKKNWKGSFSKFQTRMAGGKRGS